MVTSIALMVVKLPTYAFLSPALPLRNNGIKRARRTPSAVTSQDQWDQYESRNEDLYYREQDAARKVRGRDRHHQIFLTSASKPMFASASQRFLGSIRNQFIKHGENHSMDKRLWIAESIADDTFGMLRGEPDPPRVIVIESLETSENGQATDSESNTAVTRWTAALSRAGKALSTLQGYYVDYAVWGGCSSLDRFHELQRGCLVACEMLNADWSNMTSIGGMRELLLSHAQETVQAGNAVLCQVLPSVDEPTVFKTVEVYSCMDDLREHMTSMDPEFREKAMEYRAAVNRVRQLYRCMGSLHSGSFGRSKVPEKR